MGFIILMKILTLHCDFIRFKPVRKAIKEAEAIEKKETEVKDALVVLTAVEKSDEDKPSAIVDGLIANIKDVAKKVKTKKVVLYPYAHLSASLASPKAAMQILKDATKKLRKSFKVTAAPFGWYKQFNIQCKGHPLSELSREITAEIEIKKGKEAKEKKEIEKEGIMKEILIILPDGQIKKRKEIDKKEYENVEIVIKDELGERKSGGKEPLHLKLMKQLEIAGVENRVSDAGNLRYLPKGEFVVELLKDLCWNIFVGRLNALPTKTPCIISKEDAGAKWMMEKFPERLYKVMPGREEKKQEFYLRPACDYGTFSIFKDATISYKNLPLLLYEFEDNSWRYEQRGELLGMYRIRNFMMADLHTMCADLDQAFIEYEKQIREFAIQIYYELGFKPVAIILNCKRDFFDKYKKNFQEWAKNSRLPIVIKLFSVMKTYKVAWADVVAFDNLKRCMELTTVQLDTESSKHWNIAYIGKDNKKRFPLFLHTGIGIDRTIAALLENAAALKIPQFALWLCPTQVRIVPVSERYVTEAVDIARDLNEKQFVRADVDDRNLHVEKKIFEAEQEWIPYVLCLGKRELEKGVLTVRIRSTGEKEKEMKPAEFKKIVKEAIADMPFKPLPSPMLLSKRPKFV